MDDPWDDVERAGDWLLGLARRARPDLVHLNGYAHAALPWRRPALVVGHSCVLSWWRAVRGEPAPPAWGRYREAVARGLAGRRLVVAPAAAMLAALARHYGPLAARGGSSPTAGRPRTSRAGAAKEPFVLAAGRLWDEAKNLAALAGSRRACLAGARRRRGQPPRRRHGADRAAPAPRPPRSPRTWPAGMAAAVDLRAARALRAVRPLGARGGPGGCALVLGDIPSLREAVGRRGAVRAARTTRGAGRGPRPPDRRSADAPGVARAARPRAARASPRGAWRAATSPRIATSPRARPRPRPGRPSEATPREAESASDRITLMRIVLFYHSAVSDWNHGNAHFLRGVVTRAAGARPRGARLRAARRLEPAEPAGRARRRRRSREFRRGLSAAWQSRAYDLATLDLDQALDGADLVIVHEWNDRELVRRIGAHRAARRPLPPALPRHASPLRHRARRAWRPTTCATTTACSPSASVIRDLYLRARLGAAGLDLARGGRHAASFARSPAPRASGDLVWIGNWGDDERTASCTSSCSSRSRRSA